MLFGGSLDGSNLEIKLDNFISETANTVYSEQTTADDASKYSKNQTAVHHQNTFFDATQPIGRKFTVSEVQST
ncbi:hypothetical protein CF326_g8792 [Tilletia indica]|nr:hypothetical protein CF326_g8792 [Tilletia indica]